MVHLKSKFKVFLLILFGMVSLAGYSQKVTVTGKVTSTTDGEPLIGATVQLMSDLSKGTVTDINGIFTLETAMGESLKFSYVGYLSREIQLDATAIAGGQINIALEPNSELLDEVVIIGYGVQKKSDATGSVIAVDTKEFNKGAITSAADLITGKVAGVQITSNGGAPGEGSTIRIRGGSSMSASNDPLVVIDGIPISNDDIAGMRNPLNLVNPEDIESFTVLKDASATAIYGSRASNGVIIITTKKSKEGSPLTVNYKGSVTFSQLNKRIDVLGADEFRNLVAEKYPNQTGLLSDASTDWQNEIYENALGTDHNISVGGAFKILPYRVSVGYNNSNGILKTDNLERTTLALNLNPQFFDNHLKVNLNGKGMFTNNTFANRDAIGAALQYDPTRPIYEEGNRFGGYSYWKQNDSFNALPVEQGSANPVALLMQKEDISNVKRYVGSAQLDYKFHFLPELHANLNMAMDYTDAAGTVFIDSTAAFSYDALTGGGQNNRYEQTNKNELIDFYLNYNTNINKHRIDAMAGYSWQHFYRTDYAVNQNLTGSISDTSDNPTEYYILSFFGRANYVYNDKYLVTFTLRNDGTSRFSPDARWGLFPSVALGWNMKNESFLQDVDFLSQLKLRAGYGVTGQQAITDNDYPYLARYTYSQYDASYLLGNTFYYTLRPEAYDANIKWEETVTYNIALDYGFMKDRFYGSIDLYKRITNDMINFIPIPAGTNFSNYILTNVGNMENTGVEFSIFTRPVVTKNLLWELGLNATINKNEITKLTAIDDPDYLGVETGGISGGVGSNIQMQSVGHPVNSFFVFEQVYDQDGMPIAGLYVDRNGDGEITYSDRYHYKKPAPDFILGISSNLNYKNWTFSFSGRANFGNYVYDNVSSENGVYERLFRPEGPYLGNIVPAVYESNFTNPQYLSDFYVKNASFFRMDNMSLNYKFDNIVNNKIDINVSATVNNAFVISNYKGIDPEIENGIDNRIYLRPRIYVLGVNLVF
ncbi:MAG: TonB-dependent receptor [Bacteroidales bacterium]|nr:TonB-dependent receptor [Bacteroidales bacterium]MDD2322496.1 TonB-dependent receptor [Bacteroidales bacterium]MDD3009924.1 TonB-dependent receptor [Bacteroidales bacterium]MDD3962002.1 TonB-dependent receptor [Bacteroidales bacterium]MDY0285071.1 TonB-dependent receptor [Bacteroidales bacterium]